MKRFERTAVERGRGRRPVLVIAPHGGSADSLEPALGFRINDVGTAELAADLARELDASWIVNRGIDRNDLDLNRLDLVTERFPELVDWVVAEVRALADTAPRVEVLVVHGWNVAQSVCDVGLGARIGDDQPWPNGLAAPRDWLDGRLGRLRAALAARGIASPLGARYPARKKTNLLWLFRDVDGPLGGLVGEGRIAAAQLELGLPLRLDGPHRRLFLDAAVETFGGSREGARSLASGPDADSREPGASLQGTPAATSPGPAFMARGCDPDSGLGWIVAADGRRGRCVVFPPEGGVLLFVGESWSGNGAVPPLEIAPDGDDTRVRFDGPVLRVDDGLLFERTEAAIAAARLESLSVDLRVRRDAWVEGEIGFSGVRHRVSEPRFSPGLGWTGLGTCVEARPPGVDAPRRLADTAFRFRSPMGVLRGGPEGGRRVRFGPADVELADGRRVVGLVEVATPFPPPAAPERDGVREPDE